MQLPFLTCSIKPLKHFRCLLNNNVRETAPIDGEMWPNSQLHLQKKAAKKPSKNHVSLRLRGAPPFCTFEPFHGLTAFRCWSHIFEFAIFLHSTACVSVHRWISWLSFHICRMAFWPRTFNKDHLRPDFSGLQMGALESHCFLSARSELMAVLHMFQVWREVSLTRLLSDILRVCHVSGPQPCLSICASAGGAWTACPEQLSAMCNAAMLNLWRLLHITSHLFLLQLTGLVRPACCRVVHYHLCVIIA